MSAADQQEQLAATLQPMTTRHEIMEERGNRDAFRLAMVIAGLFLAFLIVLGIAAWNTRIAFMPLVPKAQTQSSARLSDFSSQLSAFQTSRLVMSGCLGVISNSPAPLGVAAPGTSPSSRRSAISGQPSTSVLQLQLRGGSAARHV